MISVSKNKNPTPWDDDDSSKLRVSFLNCRSIKNKFENIKKDHSMLQSDLMILTETWLDEEQDKSCYNIVDYTANFNNGGRGKGIASFFKRKFTHVKDIKMHGISVTMTKSKDLDIIGIYRSQEGDINDLIGVLDTLIDNTRTTIIGGDINVCVSKAPNNLVTSTLKNRGFS